MVLEHLWQLVAGLGIFLYGMNQMEASLRELAGRTFKLFLRKHTESRIGGIMSGTLVTGVLQSSSVVTLMVLSLVGAGIISMRNALAVVFGSNLGTTLDSWVVAALGFKFNIESFSFPIIAIAGTGLLIFPKRKELRSVFLLTMGFGLMFLGMGLMKGSIEGFIANFDLRSYADLSRLNFTILGFVLTAVIQSSSATMVITLSALNAAAIPFEAAVAVIVGSELGTTIKIVVGSIGGIAAKRGVAAGNIVFNLVITVLAYLFMNPLIAFVKMIVGPSEQLLALVLFQTVINLFGVVLFFPFLRQLGDFLEKRFVEKEKNATRFIRGLSPQLPEAVLEALEKETAFFIDRTVSYNIEAFKLEDEFAVKARMKELAGSESPGRKLFYEDYNSIKQAEGEILSLYSKMSGETIEKEDFIRLNQLVSSVKNAMYSTRGIKSIRANIDELSDSANDAQYAHYQFLQSQMSGFYRQLNRLLPAGQPLKYDEELKKLMELARKDYELALHKIYRESAAGAVSDFDIATLLNVSREVYSSCQAIVFSLRDFLLDTQQISEFDNSPFLRPL